MSVFSIYNKSNGSISKVFYGPKSVALLQCLEGDGFYKGEYPNDEYYIDLDSGEPKGKPQIQPELDKIKVKADGEDFITIANLPTDDLNGNPIETEVRVSGAEYPINDGNLELSVDAPGEYTINIRATNHKPYKATIQAYDDED